MISNLESPANLPQDVYVSVNFKNNNMVKVMRYGDPKCKFTASDGTSVIMEGQFVQYPLNTEFSANKTFVPNAI